MGASSMQGAPVVFVEAEFTPDDTPDYTSGDAFGGKLTFLVPGRGVIQNITVIDSEGNNPAMDVAFYDQDFTATADNAAWAPSDADAANLIGVVNLVLWATAANNGIATRAGIGLAYALADPEEHTLSAQCVVRAAPNYAASQTITVRLGIIHG